jgi:hypothetical protein
MMTSSTVPHLSEDDGLCGAVDVGQEEAVEMGMMARRGEGVGAIAKQLNCSRNTVRRYLPDGEACRYGPRLARSSKLDDFQSYLSERIEQARLENLAQNDLQLAWALGEHEPELGQEPTDAVDAHGA